MEFTNEVPLYNMDQSEGIKSPAAAHVVLTSKHSPMNPRESVFSGHVWSV